VLTSDTLTRIMSDAKGPGLAAMPIETSDNDSTRTKNAATLAIPVESNTERESPLWRRVLSFVWDSADGDPQYRRYVQRLDLFLL
jgi:ACS family pantothenate transporter-like MFS transporter